MARILTLTAGPGNRKRLSLEAEVREIKAKLHDTRAVSFHLIHHGAVRAADLTMVLERASADIVHFGGHGSADGIELENDRGKAQLVTAETLASALGRLRRQPRIVVLNACFSNDLAKPLIEVVDVVVGMSHAVRDQASIAFAAGFYTGLCFGKSAGVAFEAGKSQIPLEGLQGSELPQIRHRDAVDPKSVCFLPRPEIHARLLLDREGKPKKEGKDFAMTLSLRGAPEETSSVTYHVAHDDVDDAMWEVRREEHPEFESDDVSLYGDVEVRAVAWSHEGGEAVRSRLIDALRRVHGNAEESKAIKTALAKIAAD